MEYVDKNFIEVFKFSKHNEFKLQINNKEKSSNTWKVKETH